MKTIQFKLIVLCLLGIQFSCNPGDFGDTNVDPLTLDRPIPSAFLTNALIYLGGRPQDLTSGLYCQYFSQSQFTDASRYAPIATGWDGIYAGPLYDLQLIIQLNADPETAFEYRQYGSNNNQIAVARILMVCFFVDLTDKFGDIPYSEALKLNPHIPYDTQESIYKDLLKNLREAVAQFDNGLAPAGDILFQGDVTKWKKFGNSLRLILAMRMSKAAPDEAKSEFVAALNDPAGLIDINADNAALYYIDDYYLNPWYGLYYGGKSYGISLPLVERLTALGDPRLTAFGQPNNQGTVIGIPYGVERDSVIAYTNAHPDWSLILKSSFRASNSPMYLLTASDVWLVRAEAAQMGWTNEDAPSLYRAGIKASFEQWLVYNPASFNTYMTSPQVSLNTDALKKIQLQRYLSFYPNAYHAYCEWRRTGIPELEPTPFAANASKQIPRRRIYPVTEHNLNTDAWKAAVARMGGDDSPDNRVWWDQ